MADLKSVPPADRLSARHLYALPVVGGCALDRSKSRLAFCVTTMDEKANAYRGSVRVVHLESMDVHTCTHGTARDAAVRWAADNLLFTSDRSGSTQLWQVDVAGGDPVALPALPGNVSAFAVSQDGLHVAAITVPTAQREEVERRGWRRIVRTRYRADGPGYFDDLPELWLIDLRAGTTRAVTDGRGFVGSPAWSPDGRTLAFTGEHAADADSLWMRELWTASADDDWRPRQIIQFGSAIDAPSWSPDGVRIAFLGSQPPGATGGMHNLRLFVSGRDGSDVRCLSANEEWTCGNFVLTDTSAAGGFPPPVWVDDAIAVLASNRGSAQVRLVSGSQPARALTPSSLSVTEFDMLDERSAICCASALATPPELYLARSSELRPLTHETQAWCTALGVKPAIPFAITCKGFTVDAWWMEGRAPQPRAAVLQIHGGPHFAYGNAFVFEFMLLAAAGFDVVYCNPRGSQTYGEGFAAAIKGDWGRPAYEDCMAALDAAIERFSVDGSRLGVAGGSYGGYLTGYTIGQTTRFKAAVAMRPATDLVSLWGTSEVGRMLAEDFGGGPFDVPDVYRRDSALTYADAIQTPLLIIHSERDYRTPVGQAEQLFTALRSRGATVEMLRFLTCDHNLSRTGPPQQRVARLEAIVDWFSQYLVRSEG
jgi:dipeptidyl aminopeptidase/acylaminoacyl peptidase